MQKFSIVNRSWLSFNTVNVHIFLILGKAGNRLLAAEVRQTWLSTRKAFLPGSALIFHVNGSAMIDAAIKLVDLPEKIFSKVGVEQKIK